MEYIWDPAKNRSNIDKHGIDFDYAIRIFSGFVMTRDDRRYDYGEIRNVAIGRVNERMLSIVFTPRGGLRRIISARSAKRHERISYDQAIRALANRGWRD